MRQQKIVAFRFLVSSKFAPVITKSIQERADEFSETQTFLSIYPFSVNYSIKAAMGAVRQTGGGKRNAAADNKAKRKKDTNLKRLGIYSFDPKATRQAKQYFEIRPRFNLDGSRGDVPNVGWLDAPKSVKPDEYNKTVVEYLKSKKEPAIIARPAKMNKRTGQLSVKAIGPSIGSTFGNIGQVAARAIGIVVDGNGRMRCPPGVPAANQFTDDVGSNCFDFTPAIGRAVLQMVQNVNQRILEDVRKIDAALPFVTTDSGEIFEGPPNILKRVQRGLASSSRVITGPTGELLGPDGRSITVPVPPSPDFERDVAELARSGKKITADMYEDEFGRLIREAYPELSEDKISKLIKQAVQRQKMKDKQNLEVREVLDYAAELGVVIDPNDADSVQRGLLKVMQLMKNPDNGGWGINLGGYISGDLESNFDAAVLEHQVKQLELIVKLLTSYPSHFGLSNEELNLLVEKNGGFRKFEKAMTQVLTGDKSVMDVFGEGSKEAELAVIALGKFAALQKMEAGNFIGLITQRRRNPKLMSRLTGIELISPFDNNDGGSDAVAKVDTVKGGFFLLLNPLRVLLNNNFDSKSEDFTLFEPDGMPGTEVAKLSAITKSVDRAGAEKARNAYLSELISLDELQQKVSAGNEYQQRYIQKSMGEIGQAMYVMNHEITHGRQLVLVQNYLKSIPGLFDSMTNEEFFFLSEDLISGREKMYSVFGRDWDYASIISNSDWLPGAIDNLPEIMQILIGKNAGGQYAMNHYYQAAFRAPFNADTIRNTQDLYAPLTRLRSEINSMDPNSTKYKAAVEVYNAYSEIYETGDDDYLAQQKQHFLTDSALTFAEMQAELYAGVESGMLELTPEIEIFLGPLGVDSDIGPNFGKTNPSMKPVVSLTRDSVREQIKNRLKFNKTRRIRKERALIDAAPETLVGDGSTYSDVLTLVDVVEGDYSDSVDKIKEALEGMSSRLEVSRVGNIAREAVIENATTQQKQNLEGDWRNSLWNSSDPVSWATALQLQPDNVVNAVEQQFIPFMDLIDSSELPNDFVAEINLPANSLDAFSSEQGTVISVGKHFTAVVHSAEDIQPNKVSTQSLQRLMILVPEGSTGLPDNTPGTQKGEVGALILPPGQIEIIGKTKDGLSVGRIISQNDIEKQLNELRQTLNSISTNDSVPISQRIVAKRAENRIERRQELARRPLAQGEEINIENVQAARKAEPLRNVSGTSRSDGLKSTTSSGRTKQILSRAKERGIDIDAYERDRMPIVEKFNGGKQNGEFYLGEYKFLISPEQEEKRSKDIQKSIIAGGFAPSYDKTQWTKVDDKFILKNWFFGDEKNGFGVKLHILKQIASAKNDFGRIEEIDKLIDDVKKMSVEDFDAAVKDAATRLTPQFSQMISVEVDDPVKILQSGRYLTAHDKEKMQLSGARGLSERDRFDIETVIRARSNVEQRFLGIDPSDTSEETTELRPASGYVSTQNSIEKRTTLLRELYGDDVQVQHPYAIGEKAKKSSADMRRYGDARIILRPEVSERALVFKGDSIAHTGSYSTALKLSTIDDSQYRRDFFDPMSILYADRTGDMDSIASPAENLPQDGKGDYVYQEAMILGSFEAQDVAALVISPQEARDSYDNVSDSAFNRTSDSNITSLIASAQLRENLLDKGIDVVLDSRVFPLDEVEPFNASMTKPWIEKQIELNQDKPNSIWHNLKVDQLVPNRDTTSYEAYLRAVNIRYGEGADIDGLMALFDHPDNEPGNDKKNQVNLSKMIEAELGRIEYINSKNEISAQRSGGLSSRTSSSSTSKLPSGLASRTTTEKINQGPAALPNGRDIDGTPKQLTLSETEEKFGKNFFQINRYFKKKYGIDVEFASAALKAKNDFVGRKEATYGFIQAMDDVFENLPGLKDFIKRDKLTFVLEQDDMPIRDNMAEFQTKDKWFTRTKLGKNGASSEISINLEKFRDDALWDLSKTQEWSKSLSEGLQDNTYLWFGGTAIPNKFEMRIPEDAPDTQKEEYSAVYGQVTQRMAYAIGLHEIGHYLDFVTREKSDLSFPSKLRGLTETVLGIQNPLEGLDDMFGSTSNPTAIAEINTVDAVSRYGNKNPQEKLAEAFTAWFLFSGSKYTSQPITPLGDTYSKDSKEKKYKEALEQTIKPLLEKLGPRVKNLNQNVKNNDLEARTDTMPLAALLYGVLPFLDVLNKKKDRSGKIGRRLARRNASSKKANKENVYS